MLQGTGADMETDIALQHKEGLKRQKITQYGPRTSKELQDNFDAYQQLKIVFDDVFEWQRKKVRLSLRLKLMNLTFFPLVTRSASRRLSHTQPAC